MKFITRKERNSTRVSLFFCALLPFTFNDPKISWSWNWEKKAWSVKDSDKVLAVHRPTRPQGWPITHCDSAVCTQSSALFAQRIVRNTLSISMMQATQHATHKLRRPPNMQLTSFAGHPTCNPHASPATQRAAHKPQHPPNGPTTSRTRHMPHHPHQPPHPPERKNFCGDAETTAFLRKFAL